MFCHLLAVGFGASSLSSLSHSFLTFKMGLKGGLLTVRNKKIYVRHLTLTRVQTLIAVITNLVSSVTPCLLTIWDMRGILLDEGRMLRSHPQKWQPSSGMPTAGYSSFGHFILLCGSHLYSIHTDMALRVGLPPGPIHGEKSHCYFTAKFYFSNQTSLTSTHCHNFLQTGELPA